MKIFVFFAETKVDITCYMSKTWAMWGNRLISHVRLTLIDLHSTIKR